MVSKQRLRAAAFAALATTCNQRVVALDIYRMAKRLRRSRLQRSFDNEQWRSVMDALLSLE
jgi:hypothetical protein